MNRAGCPARLAAALAFGVLAMTAPPALAARYALVVGIDDYAAPVPKLHGAVNDAADVAGALKASGVDRLILLTDKQATRPAVIGAWEALLAAAKAGDTIVFTYAGHGGEEPAAPGDPHHPDGRAQNFILVNYALDGPGLADRLVDDEVRVWLKRATDKGVHVIFVADACHSGGMTRSVSLALSYRAAPRLTIDRSELLKFTPPVAPAPAGEIGESDKVTFLAAVAADRLSPEVQIDGKPRGALSWAFARAVQGAADANHDGVVTEQELTTYVRTTVQQRTDNQQFPQSLPAVSRAIAVLGGTPGPEGSTATTALDADLKAAIATAEAAAVDTPLRLAIRGGAVPGPVPGAAIVASPDEADLVYDPVARTVEKRVAGIVAENVAPSGLPGIVAKWRAIEFLKAMAGQGVVPFAVAGGARTYRRGEKLVVEMGAVARPFMTLFNLTTDGKVEFLYPASPAERGTDWRGKRFSLPLQVKDPPFGAEHLVAIMSDEPLDGLHAALGQLTSPDAAVALPAALRQALGGRRIAIGIAGIFTSGE